MALAWAHMIEGASNESIQNAWESLLAENTEDAAVAGGGVTLSMVDQLRQERERMMEAAATSIPPNV